MKGLRIGTFCGIGFSFVVIGMTFLDNVIRRRRARVHSKKFI